MKRFPLAIPLILLASHVLAATNSGFGIDAFNRSISAATRGNSVFSPFSFEIDCVIFSEAFGAITRAKIAESMGVLNGLESVYLPLHETLSVPSDDGLRILHARAFCLPNERTANRSYRQWMQKTFSAEAFTFDYYNKKGAECWFRARLDGEMEDFVPPSNATEHSHYSYFDLVSIYCDIRSSSPSNAVVNLAFSIDGNDLNSILIPAISILTRVDTWKRPHSILIRIPAADNSWFYMLVPDKGKTVRDIRGEFNSNTLFDLVGGIKSISDTNVVHGDASLVVPIMDIVTTSDLKLPFGYFHFPLTGMERFDSNLKPRHFCQRVRFRLNSYPGRGSVNGEGVATTLQTTKPHPSVPMREINRPFLFFVYHEPTATIPVAGLFMGR